MVRPQDVQAVRTYRTMRAVRVAERLQREGAYDAEPHERGDHDEDIERLRGDIGPGYVVMSVAAAERLLADLDRERLDRDREIGRLRADVEHERILADQAERAMVAHLAGDR